MDKSLICAVSLSLVLAAGNALASSEGFNKKDMTKAGLTRDNVQKGTMKKASLTRDDIQKGTMKKASLSHAEMQKANMTKASFSYDDEQLMAFRLAALPDVPFGDNRRLAALAAHDHYVGGMRLAGLADGMNAPNQRKA